MLTRKHGGGSSLIDSQISWTVRFFVGSMEGGKPWYFPDGGFEKRASAKELVDKMNNICGRKAYFIIREESEQAMNVYREDSDG